MPSYYRYLDPRVLRVPSARSTGADPFKLSRQIALFGASQVGMPPPEVFEGLDGFFVVYNGVTRATRIAKLSPGTLIQVEVQGKLARRFGQDPAIGDLLP